MRRNEELKVLYISLTQDPTMLGITINEDHYVSIDEAVQCLSFSGVDTNKERLIALLNNDSRFELNDDDTMFRTKYSTSLSDKVEYKEETPPLYLYNRSLVEDPITIIRNGIHRSKKERVVMYEKFNGSNISRYRGRRRIYCIHSKDMHENGYKFYKSKTGKWVTDVVPPQYISVISMK